MSLKAGTVRLENYQEHWEKMYQEEKEKLEKIFGKLAVDIQHIGSTSIKNLSAKRIIDIAVGMQSLEDFNQTKEFFKKEPYSVKEDSVEGEELIRKGYPETSYLIHVMEVDGKRYKDTIAFRDYLRENPKKVKEYEDLKKELAIRYANERKKYTESKNEFIQKTLKEAYKGGK